MRLSVILSVAISLLCFSVPATATMPLVTEDTGTQGTGKWQLELGSQYEHDHENDVKENDVEVAPVLTYGLTDTTDVIVGIPCQSLREQEEGVATRGSGFGDASFEVKWRFYEKDGLSFAIKPGITLPTGNNDKGLGTGKVGYGAFFIATRELKPWTFHVNLGYQRNENVQDARKDIWYASLASEYELSKHLRGVGNIGAGRSDNPASGSNPAFLLGGLIYALSDSIDVDAGFKYGFTRNEADNTILLGFTFRF
jgi:hypothetical protein